MQSKCHGEAINILQRFIALPAPVFNFSFTFWKMLWYPLVPFSCVLTRLGRKATTRTSRSVNIWVRRRWEWRGVLNTWARRTTLGVLRLFASEKNEDKTLKWHCVTNWCQVCDIHMYVMADVRHRFLAAIWVSVHQVVADRWRPAPFLCPVWRRL